jgi:hypothetical protein
MADPLHVEPVIDEYTVSEDRDVEAEVAIGQVNLGSRAAYLGSEKVPLDGSPIGRGAAIKGKRLVATAFVTRSNPTTLYASAKLTLRGGAKDRSWSLRKKAKERDQLVVFTFLIKMT